MKFFVFMVTEVRVSNKKKKEERFDHSELISSGHF